MKIIKSVYALAASCVICIILNMGAAEAKQAAAEKTLPQRVLVWGDSLSAAYGIAVEEGWVSLLQQRYPKRLKVINGSISGETTQGGLTRLPDALEEHKPDLVLLELGANDGLRGLDVAVMQKNLREMIELTQKQGADVVLLGIRIPLNYGFEYTQKFEKVYLDLAEKFELPLLPFLLEPVALDFDLMQADGLHPTADAQPKVLEHVLTIFEPVLEKVLAASDEEVKQATVAAEAQ